MVAPDMEKVVSLCKRRGFIFQSSEVYGGIGSTWDYGPLGVELKNNVKRAWWRSVVYERDDMEGLDAAILMNRSAWLGWTESCAARTLAVAPVRIASAAIWISSAPA